jgi:hypothetical protein
VAGLVLVGRVLADELGSPLALLRALRGLGDPWADPVAPVLALLALLAEALAGYVLVVLALRSLCALPGCAGRVAGQVALLLTPVVVRRLLDLLVGGTLLAQATLAATPGLPHGRGPAGWEMAPATSSVHGGRTGLAAGSVPGPLDLRLGWARHLVTAPFTTRPVPRRSAVPLPPWLGGRPSNPEPELSDTAVPGPIDPSPPGSTDTAAGPTGPATSGPIDTGRGPTGPSAPGTTDPAAVGYTVAVGNTLWDIAAAHLAPRERTVPNIHRYWRQVYRANRSVVGVDPDLIHPGTRLEVRPFRRERP